MGKPVGADIGQHGEQLEVLLVERAEPGRVRAEHGDDLALVDEGHHQEGQRSCDLPDAVRGSLPKSAEIWLVRVRTATPVRVPSRGIVEPRP